jgi:hypothetical protein
MAMRIETADIFRSPWDHADPGNKRSGGGLLKKSKREKPLLKIIKR